MKLTQKRYKRLPRPRRGTAFATTDEIPGFCARIASNGVVAFVLEYRIKRPAQALYDLPPLRSYGIRRTGKRDPASHHSLSRALGSGAPLGPPTSNGGLKSSLNARSSPAKAKFRYHLVDDLIVRSQLAIRSNPFQQPTQLGHGVLAD